MKKVTSALLALTLLLSLAAGALADGDAEPAAGMDALAAAVEAAEPGDTVELAGGVYEPEGGVFTLTKPVSLAAAAGAQVEFRGAVVYDLAGTSAAGEVTLSGIKFTAVEGQECAAALVSGRGRVLNISGCTFTGWRYGAAVYPDCRSCKIRVSGSVFDTLCALSFADVNGNGVLSADSLGPAVYALCKYDGERRAFFHRFDASAAYEDADFAPEGDFEAEYPFAALLRSAQGYEFCSSLAAAVDKAVSGDSVWGLRGGDNDAVAAIRPGVTVCIREGESFGETIENYGIFYNSGKVNAVTVVNGARSLVRVTGAPHGLDIRVTDTAGREYESEGSRGEYMLAPGSYTFTFSGEGWYTAAKNVTVTADAAQSVEADVRARLSFSDVEAGAWFYDDVYAVYTSGLMDGVSETAFDPYGGVTRAMAVTIIYRLAGEPELPDANWGYPYADVDAGSWYARAVYWARMNGIVNGTGDNTFSPDAAVTREQLASMLYRYASLAGADTGHEGSYEGFSDGAEISEWAREAAGWAGDKGLITGREGGAFAPAASCLRCELAAILVRAGDVFEK